MPTEGLLYLASRAKRPDTDGTYYHWCKETLIPSLVDAGKNSGGGSLVFRLINNDCDSPDKFQDLALLPLDDLDGLNSDVWERLPLHTSSE